MKSKRGQAALEFLTTYGWAFLVILVMIGALSYFGVLSPDRFLPDKCIFGPGLGTCTESQADGTYVKFKLINALGDRVYLQSINATNIQTIIASSSSTACNGTNSSANVSINGGTFQNVANVLWPSGQTAEFRFICSLQANERFESTPVIIQYKLGAGSYITSKEGDVAMKRN